MLFAKVKPITITNLTFCLSQRLTLAFNVPVFLYRIYSKLLLFEKERMIMWNVNIDNKNLFIVEVYKLSEKHEKLIEIKAQEVKIDGEYENENLIKTTIVQISNN